MVTNDRSVRPARAERGVRALIICPTICPGGGPPGYTYNLRAGLAALADDPVLGETVRNTRFVGIELGYRNRATGPAGTPAPQKADVGVVERIRGTLSAAATRMHPRTVARRLRKALKRWHTLLSADILVFQGFQEPGEARWARRLGKTVVYMPHSPSIFADEAKMMKAIADEGSALSAREYGALHRRERALIRAAHVVVFPAPNAATPYEAAFRRVLAARRTVYVLSGVEHPLVPGTTAGAAGLGDAPGIVSVLYVGRYVPHKGYDVFLDAAEELTAEGIQASFWTLGDGALKRDSEAVTDLGWSDAPHPIIARADVIVVPNRTAYFDLLPLEAAALGRGLVLTRVGGNLDQLERLPDSVGAEPDAVADGIRAAIAHVARSRAWGARNADAFREQFTDIHMARRWAELLRELAAAPRPTDSGVR